MADQTNSTDRLTSEQPSLILALNARYEAAWDEYNRLEEAKPCESECADTNSPEWQLKWDIIRAMATNQDEVDALRIAILHQIPTTWDEALILTAHVHTMFDLTDSFNQADQPNDERRAFEVGLSTLLDFMFSETDFKGPGKHLQCMERIGRTKRRVRQAHPFDLQVGA